MYVFFNDQVVLLSVTFFPHSIPGSVKCFWKYGFKANPKVQGNVEDNISFVWEQQSCILQLGLDYNWVNEQLYTYV